MRALVSALFVFAALVALSFPALADEDADKGLELAREAAAAFKAGDLDTAISLYEQSYALLADPNSIHNLGRCYQERGTQRLGTLREEDDPAPVRSDFEHAITQYQTYLELEPDAPNRKLVEERIASARSQLRLLEPAPPPPPPPPPLPPPPPPPSELSPWPFIGMGVGVATLGVAVGFGVAALDAEAVADDAATSGVETLAAADDARTLATVSNVLFIAGGAIAGTALVFGIIDWTSDDGEAAFTVGPTHAELRVRF